MNTKKHLPLNDTQVDRVTGILRAYKHPFRYNIITTLLIHGKLSAGEIASYLDLEESYVLEQLQILINSDLVLSELSENGILYAANEVKLLRLRNSIMEFLN